MLAMPETGIGFFPDIGASYFLPRLPGAIGMYLGLTGQRIDAADVLYAGLATHFVPADLLDTAGDVLADSPDEPVDAVLNRLAGRSPVAESRLAEVRGDVDWAFGASTLGEIDKRLRHLDTPWAAAALGALESASPQSLEITHACWPEADSARCASAWRPNSPSRARSSARRTSWRAPVPPWSTRTALPPGNVPRSADGRCRPEHVRREQDIALREGRGRRAARQRNGNAWPRRLPRQMFDRAGSHAAAILSMTAGLPLMGAV
ncbi:hypothetical protein SLINC_0026 [Streptomyces lincolnensis]|uniref:3-hydroxyisobutyryl-CoA hydrolase n=1 Tax=Streptomyces lincolnensis TaxID=1915 RepID=A0A1B1M0Z7_STRLN|nr:hypothetical protein SLINC_0026 [Streptomyces lincolnensis]